MKDYYFIINPTSRGGRSRALFKSLREWVSQKLPRAIFATTAHSGHASELAVLAAKQGYKRLIAVGGDGTLHEVVNGIASLPESQRPSVGVLAAGTGGDFARLLREQYSFPKDFSWLENPREVSIDLGKAYLESSGRSALEKYFINIADVGLSGEVSRRVNASGKFLGSLEYFRSTLLAALQYRAPRVKISGVMQNGVKREFEVDLFFLIVANGRYFGGGMCVAPKADLSDQRFEVVVTEKVSYLTLIRQFPRVYLKEKLKHQKIHHGVGKEIVVESLEGDLAVDLDGEFFQAQRIKFLLLPKAVKILVPAQD